MKYFFLLLVSMFLFISPAHAVLDLQDSLDNIVFGELQMTAVMTDMQLYLTWQKDDKPAVEVASQKAVKDLESVKNYLKSLNLPQELHQLRELNLKALDKLQQIYTNSAEKTTQDLEAGFSQLTEIHKTYLAEFQKVFASLKKPLDAPDTPTPDNEIAQLILNPDHKSAYLTAIQMIKDKKYNQAYQSLKTLSDRYKNTAISQCLNLKISDCLLVDNTDVEIETDTGKLEHQGLVLLSEIVDSGLYSLVLYEGFAKWRTVSQSFYYGMSNTSRIPNQEYNRKRWQLLEIIRRQITAGLADTWTLQQRELLLGLPNIRRGTPYGNDNLFYFKLYYTDEVKQKAPEESPEKEK